MRGLGVESSRAWGVEIKGLGVWGLGLRVQGFGSMGFLRDIEDLGILRTTKLKHKRKSTWNLGLQRGSKRVLSVYRFSTAPPQ